MLGARIGHPLVDALFYCVLDIHINGRYHRIAVLGRLDHTLQVGIII